MEKFDLYKDIQLRTGGEIYAGIVGPVRTGKSAFARKFVEYLVLPELSEQERAITKAEMPASASGRTVTTVEPKFIPRSAVEVVTEDGTVMHVRVVDCVGFLVPGAEGVKEDQMPRMVKTPWLEMPVPFQEAARLGTQKVIRDHATIGIVITTDGSFGELPRESFLEAEKEAITELQKIGKPFLVIVNSADPSGGAALDTAQYLKDQYQVTPMLLNCEKMGKKDLNEVFEQFLLEFPLTRVMFRIPGWAESLEEDHWLKKDLFQSVKKTMEHLNTVRDMYEVGARVESPYIRQSKLEKVNLANGTAEVDLVLQEALYYQILSEMTGTQIQSEYQLISLVREMAKRKREYEGIAAALEEVRRTGYGVVVPQKEEIKMEEPAVIRQGSRYGVKIRAVSPSIHLIRAEIETEIAPLVGSEEQARDLISYMKGDGDERNMWNTLIFGKSVEQMVEDGIRTKLASIGEESRQKLQETMKRIVNESRGRLICIIL